MRHQVIALALIVFVPIALAAPPYPAGCVDCHVKDNRVSVLLAHVDAKNVAPMQAFVPKGITLKGKHPPVAAKDVPASCMKCHAATSKTIPPFAPLIHGIHLAKAESGFVKQYGGECTHCHKLNRSNGVWSMPSGAEK